MSKEIADGRFWNVDKCANCVHRVRSDSIITDHIEIMILCDKDMQWHLSDFCCDDCVSVPPELPPWCSMRSGERPEDEND